MKHPEWTFLNPQCTLDTLGWIPQWLNEDNPEPAHKQIDQNYRHGGGWRKTNVQFKIRAVDDALIYPGDPPQKPLAKTKLRDEEIIFYPHAWVMIRQKNGSFEICRVD